MAPLSRGVREREARKRRRRVIVGYYDHSESKWVSLKLGSKKLYSHFRLIMADSEKPIKRSRSIHGS